jgi:hypothetical protein
MLFVVVMATLIMLAMPTDALAHHRAYSEGIYFFFAEQEMHWIQIEATKSVDGRWREALVSIQTTGYQYFNETAILYEDPDGLEVSRDLGWGGLEGQITAYDPAHNRYHVLEFHVWQFATERNYVYDPASGYFKRPARVEGYVLMDGLLWWDFNAPMTHPQAGTHGYNFSDQWPGY